MFVSQERRRATQTFENQTNFALRFAPEGYANEQAAFCWVHLIIKFSAFKVFTKDVIPGYSKQDVRARCEGCFSLGASRRNVPLAGAPPSYTNFQNLNFRSALRAAMVRKLTRDLVHNKGHYKGRYKGTLQGSLSKYLWVSPPN